MFLQPLLLGFSLVASGVAAGEYSVNTSSPIVATVNAPQIKSNTQVKSNRKRPAPPRRLPPNRVKPGGGLDTAKQSCKNSSESLVALVPVQNPVLTASTHPTLLFYVSDAANDIREGKSSIFTQDNKTRVYETRFTLPQAPGIISIRLPESAKVNLQEGEPYQWYFKLYCQGAADSRADLDVNGWIQRVALTPERQQLIRSNTPDIWYDALANLAQNIRSRPQDPVLQQRWTGLLKSIGMEQLAQQPIVGSVKQLERDP
jgi:hypothetical protein